MLLLATKHKPCKAVFCDVPKKAKSKTPSDLYAIKPLKASFNHSFIKLPYYQNKMAIV